MSTIPPLLETIAKHGYALVLGHRPNSPSIDALSDFGKIETLEGLNAIQALVPQERAEAPPNTYSGNFGVAEFPLHTDLAHWASPPRFFALRCVSGSRSIPTRVLDGQTLTEHFGPELLRRTLVQPRRPMKNGKQFLQLLERVDSSDQFRLRWDSIYLRPATRQSSEAFSSVLDFISRSQPAQLVLLERGDTLIIDNWRCLHGRASVPEDAIHRHIDRAYLRSVS